MPTGTVEAVFLAGEHGDPPESVDSAAAVAGGGLRGDRHFEAPGDDPESGRESGCDLTLVEAEAVDAIASEADIDLAPGAHRRNVVTRGVPLNHLVGERFRVGEVVCEGQALCEPCGHLQSLVGEDGLVTALTHRGGLEARVVESGTVATDDAVEWDAAER